LHRCFGVTMTMTVVIKYLHNTLHDTCRLFV